MSVRHPQPVTGQLGFEVEGMPQAQQELPPSLAGTKEGDYASIMKDLLVRNPKVGFGRVVMPYYFNLDPRDYTDITPRMVECIQADAIEPFLYSSVSNAQVDGLVLPSDEYEGIVRYPRALNAAVETKEFGKSAMDNDLGRRTTGAQEKAAQSLAKKVEKMQSARDGITQEHDIVAVIAQQARHPGYAHLNFFDMHTKVSAIRETYFGRILEVVGREKEWTADQFRKAQRSLDVLLFMTGNERVGHFRNWLGLELRYVTRRGDLFDKRIHDVSKMIIATSGTEAKVK